MNIQPKIHRNSCFGNRCNMAHGLQGFCSKQPWKRSCVWDNESSPTEDMRASKKISNFCGCPGHRSPGLEYLDREPDSGALF